MKKLTISLVAAVSGGGVALAADLPSRKAPAVYAAAPILTWSGFYVGVNAGATFGDNSIVVTGGPLAINPAGAAKGAPAVASALGVAGTATMPGSGAGFIGGGQIGYNWQVSPAFVAGLEADIQGVIGRQSSSVMTFASFGPFGFPANSYFAQNSASRSLDYLGTLRARIGYLVAPSLLLYGTGGLAYGGVKLSSAINAQQTFPGATPAIVPPVFGGSSFSTGRLGFAVGLGGEWMFAQNWSAKFEYLYYDLGSVVAPISMYTQMLPPDPWGSAASQTLTRINGHILRAGLNYHFNWGSAPVVARY